MQSLRDVMNHTSLLSTLSQISATMSNTSTPSTLVLPSPSSSFSSFLHSRLQTNLHLLLGLREPGSQSMSLCNVLDHLLTDIASLNHNHHHSSITRIHYSDSSSDGADKRSHSVTRSRLSQLRYELEILREFAVANGVELGSSHHRQLLQLEIGKIVYDEGFVPLALSMIQYVVVIIVIVIVIVIVDNDDN